MPDICNLVRDLVKTEMPEILSLRNDRTTKADGSWVTKADLYVQDKVQQLLGSLPQDILLISEESVPDLAKAETAEYVVTLDPIDGTTNFTYGMADWGVLVSVYRNMKHFQSMVLLPEMNRCIVTGESLQRSTGSRLRAMSTFISPEDFAALDRTKEYRMIGSTAVNFYYMLIGAYSGMRHYKGGYSWDILAGINLCLEHGLKVSVDGKEYKGEWLAPGIRYKYQVSEE